jgi:UDP-N-acetylglucosamine--N-acetylmuramyl-(pentapeptide) pyrophosphoryl-undecaprenol N-acetylglucosamine transferase
MVGTREGTHLQSLLVASAGGHLEELYTLRPRLAGLAEDVTWVTWDTAQSRSLLAGEQRFFVDRAEPRDVGATVATARAAHHLLALGRWANVVSTGSLPAVPFIALARARGIPCHFIESATRSTVPSLSGRIVARARGVHLYSQYHLAPGGRWLYRGSVFDGYSAVPVPAHPLRRVVVSVGSSRFQFRRMVVAVAAILAPGEPGASVPPEVEILWQTGHTDVSGLGIDAVPFLPAADFAAACRDADAVICHAGVGSALAALASGHRPVLVPRRVNQHEHVDDHQWAVASDLAARGLAVACDPDDLDLSVVQRAASKRVQAAPPPPFELVGALAGELAG